MTDNELNALVAERVMDAYNTERFSGEWTEVEPGLYQLPDYCNDIAAAVLVESRIKELDTKTLYIDALSEIVAPEYASIFFNAIELDPHVMELNGLAYLWLMVTATPKQRCLAALKAVGIEVE